MCETIYLSIYQGKTKPTNEVQPGGKRTDRPANNQLPQIAVCSAFFWQSGLLLASARRRASER